MKIVKEFYAIALQLSDDEQLMYSLVQEGTSNTKETSNLVTRLFPYSPMKHIITNIQDNHEVVPEQYFKVKVTEEVGKIEYEFYPQERTEALDKLFTKPDYFEDLDISFLNGE